jgi:DNA polymerase III subunit beta
MKFTAPREDILGPLQNVIGVVERRQTMPVLSNVLIGARNNRLSMTGTDLEVELVCTRELTIAQSGDVTVPGRKFLDILRAVPDGTAITIATEGERLSIKAGRSRFTLAMLPASEFPVVDEISAQQTLSVAQGEFRRLIDKTHFSMAQQDVRYYLNGLLLEADGKTLRAVATDGHRLSLCECALETKVAARQQVIIPRKAVGELQRLLGSDGALELQIGNNHVRATIGEVRFTSKLIDGRFPEYGRVIPSAPTKRIEADCQLLRQALQRTAILSNEKFRGIRLALKTNQLTLSAHNPEQEEAEDQVEVDYSGEDIEIGFNVNYLLDALSAIDGDRVQLGLSDSNSSGLLTQPGSTTAKYVVMPMRL